MYGVRVRFHDQKVFLNTNPLTIVESLQFSWRTFRKMSDLLLTYLIKTSTKTKPFKVSNQGIKKIRICNHIARKLNKLKKIAAAKVAKLNANIRLDHSVYDWQKNLKLIVKLLYNLENEIFNKIKSSSIFDVVKCTVINLFAFHCSYY